MKIRVEDLNLRIANMVSRAPPKWFTPDLEFDFPMQVRAGNIVLIKDYGGETVVVLWLWESRDPVTEERVGEVFFINKGTEESPQIVSAARQLEITERGP